MNSAQSWLLAVVGGVIGGTLGYFAFGWVLQQGFYALVLPAAGLGYGASWLSKGYSPERAIGCAVAGVVLALFAEWRFQPFTADDSLGYFVSHLHKLKGMTWLMVALSGYVGYRCGLGSDRVRTSSKS